MSLIQRNAVPLFVLIAVIAVGVGVFASTSPFAFGEEPVDCDAAAVGISVYTTDDSGNSVAVVSNGDVVTYRVTLSIPELPAGETACNYVGGALAVTLPDGSQVPVAGTDGTEAIPTIQVGAPFTAQSVSYTINQNDAINGELTVRANYSGGSSLSVGEGEQAPEAAASVSNVLRMTPPSIDIEKITTTPIVYLGQTAGFNITVTNTGGYALSNVTVTDSQVESCDGMSFGTLAVGQEKTDSCSTLLDSDISNEAYATASVPGGPPAGMETITSEPDTASVSVEALSIGITVGTTTPHIRLGNQGEVEITVIMPPQTAVNNVNVTVETAPQCGSSWDVLPAGAVETYTCVVETDPATEGSLPLGTTTVTGIVTGSVPDVHLEDDASVDVSVFGVGLNITITPKEQTIREGDTASFTVTVSNDGDDVLSNVQVTNETVPSCANDLGSMAPGDVPVTYDCVSDAVSEDLETTVKVAAVAADGAPEEDEDSAYVNILRPSTAIGVSEVNTMVLRLVVQTLRVTETNDGDSPLTNICVEFDPTGAVLPHTAMDAMGMEGEGMMEEGEAMEAMTYDPCTEPPHGVMVLTRDSVEFVGGDYPNEAGELGIMEEGETWEWRVVTVGVAGNYVALSEGAGSMNYVAIGHGTDILGGDVTYPGDVEELAQIEVPITAQ
ncbi:MAG: DUF11 domain-containing protein [Chloroflexi bacterium]|nr:DUF11 domain-containing protein [Chloroflexota bacterium]